MLLSIVMIVKDEEENLLKSLPSLDKLRNKIDCELVILDTGSIDNTINISKQYTERVYQSTWDNNFSITRNKAISYAKGEWILVIDADEELVNCDNLIDFFKSKKHIQYNSALITLRNFTSEDLSTYTNLNAIRLFKKKGFKYEGAVHEQPIYKCPVYKPKNGIAYFNHYGYISEKEDITKHKIKRNIDILFNQLKKNPLDAYAHYQLGANFNVLKKYEEAKNYLEQSLILYNLKGILYHPAYLLLIHLLFNNKEYEYCKYICLKYLTKDDCNIDVHFILAEIYKNECNFKSSIKHYNKYLFYIDNYNLSRHYKDINCASSTLDFKPKALINLASIYFNLKKYEESLNIINNIKKEYETSLTDCYDILIRNLDKLNKKEMLIDYYNDLKNETDRLDYLISLENYLSQVSEYNCTEIFSLFSSLNNDYGKLNSFRSNNYFNINEAKLILLNNKDLYFADLIRIALNKKECILELLKDIDYFKADSLIKFLINNNNFISIDLFEFISDSKLSFDNNKNMIFSIICETLLDSNKLCFDKKLQVFQLFIESRYRFIKDTFNYKIIDQDTIPYLNKSIDLFTIKYMIYKKISNQNYSKGIEHFKKLSKEFPQFSSFIELELDLIKSKLDIHNDTTKLSTKYKSLIKNEIFTGNLDMAEKILFDLNNINKSIDYEIFFIESLIKITQFKFKEGHDLIKKSYLLNPFDLNTVFNLGYLYYLEHNYTEALNCFYKVIKDSNDKDLISNSLNNIKLIKSIKK
ncbi:MAG: glycosyltransferase [Clostridium sp.]|nr:glycosyltransferase [Clostridium sp.]